MALCFDHLKAWAVAKKDDDSDTAQAIRQAMIEQGCGDPDEMAVTTEIAPLPGQIVRN